MSANKFVLKHHSIEVHYTIGITPGLPALIYKDGADEKTFKSSEITTDNTGVGSLVSVLRLRTIDTGGEKFGFFLPQLDVPSGQTEKFSTVGMYEKFSGPDSIPHVAPSWSCVEFHGTAQTVIVPL
jgi:hypothetical protein